MIPTPARAAERYFCISLSHAAFSCGLTSYLIRVGTFMPTSSARYPPAPKMST